MKKYAFYLLVLENKSNFANYNKNRIMSKKVPNSLIKRQNIVKLVLFVAFFAFVFIIIFKPFNSNKFLSISTDRFAAYASIIAAIGLGVLVISRLLMYIYCSKTSKSLTYTNYITWVLIEVLSISLFCNLFAWLIGTRTLGYFDILPDTISYTLAILFLPYVITLLYFELQEKNIDIEKLKATPTEGGNTTNDGKHTLINLHDDKGHLKLSVDIDNLFFIEAADNYVNIYYSNKDKISKFCLRNSLKNMENINPNIIRCHRSYMVNFSKVKVLRREKDGLFIELDSKDIPDIPISKTYSEKIIHALSN